MLLQKRERFNYYYYYYYYTALLMCHKFSRAGYSEAQYKKDWSIT